MPDYVHITTSGQVEVAAFTSLLHELTTSSEWIKGTKQLVDHRNLRGHLSPGDIKMIQNNVRLFADRLGNGKCAFVMRDIADFLTSEFYASSQTIPHSAARSFSDIKPALFWLLLED